MAYLQVQLLVVVAAVACLAPLASATVFMVGDGQGWRARFNETHWADNKTFVVGDSLSTHDRDGRQHQAHATRTIHISLDLTPITNCLAHAVFMYNKENHTVAQVGKDDFVACNLQGNQLKFWDSGNDVVTLDKPGKVWFICTKPGHCLNGMKLVIDVQAPAGGPSAEPPSSAPVSYTVGGAVAAAGAVLAAVLAF
jgi:hypothetical protein